MKKVFLAMATAVVALFGLTGCGEYVQKDVVASVVVNFGNASGASLSDVMAINTDVLNIFIDELMKMDGAQKFGDNHVNLPKQTSEKAAAKAIKAACDNADIAVKAKYPTEASLAAVSFLSVSVIYTWENETTLKYEYKKAE